ncbi:MAG TPA: hypothetical protein VFR81_26660, partial [Longimicrobium sp.]|nr:hypothetical protein [Longimicrobium sp.]
SAAAAALRDDAEARLLEVEAVFPRPEDHADHPLLVRVHVERAKGAAAPEVLKERVARRVGEAVARRVPGATPLVDVTVLEPHPAGGR